MQCADSAAASPHRAIILFDSLLALVAAVIFAVGRLMPQPAATGRTGAVLAAVTGSGSGVEVGGPKPTGTKAAKKKGTGKRGHKVD